MKNNAKVGILVAMILACLSLTSETAMAQHHHHHRGTSFGLTLPSLGLYVGNDGVSVGTRGFQIDTRRYYNPSPYRYNPGGRYSPTYPTYPSYPGGPVPYSGRRPYQYVPPVSTYPRPYTNPGYDYDRYRRQQNDYRRQQEEIRRAQERYQRDLERIQRQYRDCR